MKLINLTILISIFTFCVANVIKIPPSPRNDDLISCNYSAPIGAAGYSCTLSINNPIGLNNFTRIGGDHIGNFTDADVERVYITYQNTRNIPIIICQQFPNILDLMIGGSQIQVVDSRSFAGCRRLEFLMLASNNIGTVPSGTFSNNPNLEVVMMEDNGIRNIGANIFSGTKVTYVDLSANALNAFQTSWFNGVEANVEVLLLSFNRLPLLPAFSFERFANLRELDLSNNPFTSLYQNIFFGLSNLRRLFMNGVGLSVNPLWFIPLTNIEHINLHNNQIRELPNNTFHNLQSLLTVGLEYNDLTFIDASAFGNSIGNIRNLYLGYNRIQAVDEELLNNAASLMMLGLNQNECLSRNFNNVPNQREEIAEAMQVCYASFIGSMRCQFIDFDLYPYECLLFITNPVGRDLEDITGNHTTGRTDTDVQIVEALYQNTRNFPSIICRRFPNVVDIWMEESQLEIINADAFVDCQNLWRVILSYNRITNIPDGLFRNSPTLQQFEASSNHISQVGFNAFNGTALYFVNLHNNRIAEFIPFTYEVISTTLTNLYLSQNNFNEIEAGAFNRLSNLVELSLSHNNLRDIPANAFRYLTRLESLELMNCSLNEINPQWFENLYSLKELRLESNNIHEIPERTFVNIRGLEVLAINENSIRNIHANSFGNLSSLIYFMANGNGVRAIDRNFFDRAINIRWMLLQDNRCFSENIYNIQYDRDLARQQLSECFNMFDGFVNCTYADGFIYYCFLTIQNVEGRDDFTEVTGTHIDGKGDNDVIFVDADSQDTRNIPSIICSQFPNMEDLIIRSSFVQFIDENTFEDCTQLEFLTLDGNAITSIPDFAFVNNRNLFSIELYNNRISSIGPNAFANLQLQMIDLELNQLTQINSRWFASVSNSLVYLYLPSNRLQSIDVNAFEHLQSLAILDIGINPGIQLPSNVFRSMPNLTRLYLDENEIREVHPLWFAGLSELRYLTLYDNRIENLQPGVFDHFSRTHQLDLGHNPITMIHSDAFGSSLSNLQFFYNDENPTSAIDPQFFDNATSLNYLFLSHNLCVDGNFYNIQVNRDYYRQYMESCFNNFNDRGELSCVYNVNAANDTICTLTANNPSGHDDYENIEGELQGSIDNVRDVQCRYQNTRIVPRILCSQFTGLRRMTVSYSRVHRLSADSFMGCNNLITLSISANRISTIASGTFSGAPNLESLGLSSNLIHTIADNAFAGTVMEYLYLNDNLLTTINRAAFNSIETTLEDLFLYSNQFREIPENSFEGLEELEFLDIGLNPTIRLPSNVFNGLTELEALYIDGNNLDTLDPNWFTTLESLEDLDIYENNVRILPDHIFANLTSLFALFIDDNPIEVLNANIFGDNIRTIEYIIAAGCRIEAIDERLLNESDNLDILYLYDNVCISTNFFDVLNNRVNVSERLQDCFGNFRGSADCYYNMNTEGQHKCYLLISNIAGHDQFTSIGGTHMNNSGNNDIVIVESMYQVTRNIPSVICTQFPNVFEIFLEDSRIERITVQNCANLRNLILAYNEISSIDADTFANNPNLELLDVHFNRILTIADDAFAGSSLGVLNLGMNPLGVFNPAWLTSVSGTLRDFRLYESRLMEIPNEAFSSLSNLEFLDVGINRHLQLPPNAFNNLGHLQSLYIDTCFIRNIEPQWFLNLTSLRDLHLHSNNLRTLPAGSFNNLTFFYLSIRDNRISTINSDAFGDSLNTIESFYATNNRINAIERNFFDRAVDLDSLYLFDNVCVNQNFRQVVQNREFVSQELSGCFDNFE